MADLPPVPGKLMLGGEYAVLRPGGLCLAVAVGRLVELALGDPVPEPRLTLAAFGQSWTVGADSTGSGLAGFAAATLAWLAAQAGLRPLRALHLRVGGAIGGAKVGLGTSAAVTVATLRAALAACETTWPADRVAAAARAVHAHHQGARGSGYDVTTIACGGVLAFRPDEGATALRWPAGLYAAALFSGAPAPTAEALARAPLPRAALDAIASAAEGLLEAFGRQQAAAVLAAAAACEAAFGLAADAEPRLLPAASREVREVIAAAGCVARTSGAGGGDCVLAFATNPAAIDRAIAGWWACGGHVVARLPTDLAESSI